MQDTLLHEMIHAYLFTNGQHRRDGDHGPRFKAKMHEINSSSLPDHQVPSGCSKSLQASTSKQSTVDIMQGHDTSCRTALQT